MMGGWDLPGRQGDPARWNLDPKKGWIPPGVAPDKSRLTYTLPYGVSPDQIPNWHLLASPEGTAAPRDLLNYTHGDKSPIAPIGAQAPVHRTNFSMLPARSPAPSAVGSSPFPSGAGAGDFPVGAGQAEGEVPWWQDSSVTGVTNSPPADQAPAPSNPQPDVGGPVQGPPSPSNPPRPADQADRGGGTRPGRTSTTTRSTTDAYGGTSTSTSTTTVTDPSKVSVRVVRANGREMLVAVDPDGHVISQQDLGSAGTARNTTRAIKIGNSYRLVTFDPDGNIVNERDLGSTASSPTSRGGASKAPPRNTTRQYTVIGEDGQPHRMEEVTDPQGSVVDTRDLGLATGSKSQERVREYTVIQQDGAPHRMRDTIDASGAVQSTQDLGVAPGNRPGTVLGPGQSLVNTSSGATIASVGQQPIVQQVGNQLLQIDPNTGSVRTLSNIPQPLSIQSSKGPSGEEDLFGIDPYTGQSTSIYHRGGQPRDLAHAYYLPEDWTGDYPVFDPSNPAQPKMAHHQGVAWSPPAGMRQANAAHSAPSNRPPAYAPAPEPDSAPAAPRPLLAPGLAGTAEDTGLGPTPPGAFPLTPAVEGWKSPIQYDLTPAAPDLSNDPVFKNDQRHAPPTPVETPPREDNPVGEGQDVGGMEGMGNVGRAMGGVPWKPPIDPQQVVGTGHKFGEPVSIEGVHKGVDLQAVRGTPAKSPVDGTVVRVENNPRGLGITVTIRDAQGHEHTLGHLGSVTVKRGDHVRAGQPVAHVGSTGASTGPHLDVREKTPSGQHVDPSPKLGPLAHLPRADNGMEPGERMPMPDIPIPQMGSGQDVGVGGMRLANGNWSDALADTPENRAKYGPGSGYQGGYGYNGPTGNNRTGGGGGGGGAAGGGGGGGGGGSIQPNWYDQAYINHLMKQLQQQQQQFDAQLRQAIQAENDRHQEAIRAADTADKATAENGRHNQAMEQIQMQQAELSSRTQMALAGLQSGTQVGIANAQIAAQFGLNSQQFKQQMAMSSQQFKQQVATSALQNPWLQRLTGMLPGYGEPGGPGGRSWTPPTGGTTFANILQDATSATPPPDTTGAIPPQAQMPVWPGQQSNPQQGMAQWPTSKPSGGSPYTGPEAVAMSATGGPPYTGPQAVSGPANLSSYGATGNAGGSRVGGSIGGLTGGGSWTPPNMPTSGDFAQAPVSDFGLSNNSGSSGGSPSFQNFESWSPFQQAAWRTGLEAQGPGSFQRTQDQLLTQWGQQGITGPSDTTQLSWDQSGPIGQMAKGNQAEFFGKSPNQWLGGQQSHWAKGRQAQVSLA